MKKTAVLRLLTLMQVLWTHTVKEASKMLETSSLFMAATESYLDFVLHFWKHKGKVETTKLMKLLHSAAVALATGGSLPEIPFCKVDRDGWPLRLKSLGKLLRSTNSDVKRLALTITRLYEYIVCRPIFDPSPIQGEGPAIDPQLLKEFDSFCSWWTKKLNIKNLSLPKLDKILGNLVQGPNGPSIATSHYDAQAVLNDPELADNLREFASLSGNEWIYDYMVIQGQQLPRGDFLHSRISLLQQGGGKTRVIAIGDFWSQNLLRGLHDVVMGILRGLRTDGTWDQDSQARRISFESLGFKTFSFDLSNATDRFPVILQEILLSHVFSPEIARSWRKVLTDRSFHIRGQQVRWRVGQPLGLLSSWAVFALTHHAFIEFVAFREGFKSFTRYAVLGDDVAIWSERVAASYAALLQKMGIPINWGKSLVSDDLFHRVEFAKRIFLNGIEVTGLKFDILSQASRSIYMLVDLIQVAKTRSWSLSWTEFQAPSFLSVKGKELLSILLWERACRETCTRVPGSDPLGYAAPKPGFSGRVTDDVKRPSIWELWSEMIKIRIELLREKKDSLEKFWDGRKSIEDLFKREGVAYSAMQIGSFRPYEMHPISWCINQVGESLYETLGKLEEAEANWDGITTPEFAPVEYLPLPDTSVYFGDRHRLRSEYRSSIVLKAWTRLAVKDNDKNPRI